MSKILEFNARDFSVDTTVEGNCASRVFVTMLGQCIEQYEVGDWRWQWSQILSDRALEPNTDYVLRFAVTGGMCDTKDELCRCIITPLDFFEERMEFDLAHSRFQPVLSKDARADFGLLRVFEIPFNTRMFSQYRILFISHHCITKFMPAFPLEAYAALPDLTYAELWAKRSQQRPAHKCGDIDLSDAVIPAHVLHELLQQCDGDIDLSGAVIEGEPAAATPKGDSVDAVMRDWMLKLIAKNTALRLSQLAEMMVISEDDAQRYLQTLVERHTIWCDADGNYQLLQE